MNLDLPDLALVPKIITCTVEGILEEEDLLALLQAQPEEQNGGGGVPVPEEPDDPSNLKRVREKHHSVARLVAQGMTQRLVATITGYSESYLSILLNNPSMVDLVSHYRAMHGNAAEIVGERLRTVGLRALERLDSELDKLDHNALIQTAKLGLDRSGHGPSSTQHVVAESHLIDHAELQRLNQQARQGSAEFIVPMRQVREALPAPKDEEE